MTSVPPEPECASPLLAITAELRQFFQWARSAKLSQPASPCCTSCPEPTPPALQLEELAPEILVHVVRMLPTRDLACLAASCRRFHGDEPASVTEEALRQRAKAGGYGVPTLLPRGAGGWVPYLLRRERWRGAEQHPIAAGKVHSLFIDDTGALWSCGCEFDDILWVGTPGVLGLGQLPLGSQEAGDRAETMLPLQVPGMAGIRVRSLATRDAHSLALDADGNVYSWGGGHGGRLGHGDEAEQLTPRLIAALTGTRVRAIATGTGHSAAVSEDGALFTWGGYMSGSCGLGYKPEGGFQPVPRQVDALEGSWVACVAAGSGFTIVSTDDGTVYSFGAGGAGQLGHGLPAATYVEPKRVDALEHVCVRAISAGNAHVLALADDGVVFSWGNAPSGRNSLLGRRSHSSDGLPQPVEGLEGERVRVIAAGNMHNCAVTESGALFTWGDHEWGKLGHGASDTWDLPWRRRNSNAGFTLLPTRVKALEGVNVVSVSAGCFHTLAVAEDGTLYGWGDDRNGCISSDGDASLAPRPQCTPRLISDLRVDCTGARRGSEGQAI